ncbi:hypothetical protein [Pseudoalteromonas sp.]|uniref:hypothetical protein n=1 Tax=Pseudoalteromonas sp. TaxID=53249 RepID=UPI00356869DC
MICKDFKRQVDGIKLLSQQFESELNVTEVSTSIWQTLALAHPDTEITYYHLSALDYDPELKSIVRLLANGKSYIVLTDLTFYLKLNSNEFLHLYPIPPWYE